MTVTCDEVDKSLTGDDGRVRELELEHIADCERCRALWLSGALVAETGTLLSDFDRLDGASLAVVPAELERRAIQLGLHSTRLVSPSRRPRTIPRWTIPLAAAAGLAFVAIGLGLLLLEQRPGLEPGPPSGLRSPASVTITPVSPTGALSETDPLAFEWTRTGAEEHPLGPLYRLVVMDLDSGETVLDARVEGTSYVPTPAEVEQLRPNVRYHWLVEPIGAGVPSEPAAFHVVP